MREVEGLEGVVAGVAEEVAKAGHAQVRSLCDLLPRVLYAPTQRCLVLTYLGGRSTCPVSALC